MTTATLPARTLPALCLLLILSACDSNKEEAAAPLRDVVLSVDGLIPLANGAVYEGWAVIRNAPFSTGRFNVTRTGNVVGEDGLALPGGAFQTELDLDNATAFFISLEPKGDNDAQPAPGRILGADMTGPQATLTPGHARALDTDFSTATGVFTLGAFTTEDTSDDLSGLWFMDPGPPAAGLALPPAPDGWRYEGWVLLDDTPLSTGTFVRIDAQDEVNLYSTSEEGPAFPGQDFLVNPPLGLAFPTDLSGADVLVTLEPAPDSSPEAPFSLEVLTGAVPAAATPGVVYPLENNAGNFPSGTVTFRGRATP